MIAGARVDVAPYKRHPADFVLWKPSKPRRACLGEPLGPGPSRLAHRVHGDDRGGAGAAQSTSTAAASTWSLSRTTRTSSPRGSAPATATEYAHYWLHNGFLNMAEGEKMSKSLGNVALAHELLKA